MPRTQDQLDVALLKAENELARLKAQNVELGTRLSAAEKLLSAGPTVSQSLAAIAHNTDRMAQAAFGPYGGEK